LSYRFVRPQWQHTGRGNTHLQGHPEEIYAYELFGAEIFTALFCRFIVVLLAELRKRFFCRFIAMHV
jgi:hypothetical protein